MIVPGFNAKSGLKLYPGAGVRYTVTMTRENLRLFRGSLSPAGFRCLVSAVATAVQLAIFLYTYPGLMNWQPQPQPLFWCWVIDLEIGILFGFWGFCLARSWTEGILAFSLLCFQLLSLCILFLIGVASYINLHGITSIH